MNGVVRNFLYFCVGVLLSAVVLLAHADTIPASTGTVTQPATMSYTVTNGGQFATCLYGSGCLDTVKAAWLSNWNSSHASACTATWVDWATDSVSTLHGCSYEGGQTLAINTGRSCPSGYSLAGYTCSGQGYVCPSGQNWTLAGETCTRPDCPLGYEADGTCKDCATLKLSDGTCAEPCTAGVESEQFNKDDKDYSANTYCGSNNCSKALVSRTPVGTNCSFGSSGFGLCQTGYWITTKTTGAYCDYGAGGTPNTNQPDGEENNGPCPAGYGSVTSAGGFLRCLPPGTSEPTKTETIETNPGDPDNPTKTETVDPTVTKTECVGETCTKTTQTVDANGKVITNIITQTKDVFCENNPNNAACKEADSGGDGGSGSDGDGYSFSAPGAGEFAGKDDEIAQAKQAISDKLTQIKGEASQLLGSLTTGAGALPCPDGVALDSLKTTFKLCAADYQTKLAPISSAMFLIGALAALFIIFR